MSNILIPDNGIIDIKRIQIEVFNKKYKQLRERLNNLKSERLDMSLSLANMDKIIFLLEIELEKIEKEVLSDMLKLEI